MIDEIYSYIDDIPSAQKIFDIPITKFDSLNHD